MAWTSTVLATERACTAENKGESIRFSSAGVAGRSQCLVRMQQAAERRKKKRKCSIEVFLVTNMGAWMLKQIGKAKINLVHTYDVLPYLM